MPNLRGLVAALTLVACSIPSAPAQAASQTLLDGRAGQSLTVEVSPDLQYAAISGFDVLNAGLPGTIDLVRLDGSQRTNLYTQPSSVVHIVGWTSDSRAIIVRQRPTQSTSSLGATLLRLPLDGSGIAPLATTTSDFACSFGCFYDPRYYGQAADGALIVSSFRRVGDHVMMDFFRAALSGTSPPADPMASLPITEVGQTGTCSLTPHGRWMICTWGTELVQINTVSGLVQRRIMPFGTSSSTITRDSRWLITPRFIPEPGGSGGSIALPTAIPIEWDGPPIQLSDQPVQLEMTALADGTVLSVGTSRTQIYRLRPDRGPNSADAIVDLASSPTARIQTMLVTADGQHIVYSIVDTVQPSLKRIYSLAINRSGAIPTRLDSISDSDRYSISDPIITDQAQLVVTQIYDSMTSLLQTVAIPIDGPASAAVIVQTDGLDQNLRIAGAVGSTALLENWNQSSPIYAVDLTGQIAPRPIMSPAGSRTISGGILRDGRVIVYDSSEYGGQNAFTQRIWIADIGILRGGFAIPALCVSEGSGYVSIPVELMSAPSDTRSISYALSGGTADAGDSTLPISGTLTFAAGQRWAALSIPVVADAVTEGSETLLLTLSADPASITLDQAAFTLTIRDTGACQAWLPLHVTQPPKELRDPFFLGMS